MRFRHADSDIVRAARQQDFLRQAKDQISSSSLIDHARQADRHLQQVDTQTDKQLATRRSGSSGCSSSRCSPPATRSARSRSRRSSRRTRCPTARRVDYVTADPARGAARPSSSSCTARSASAPRRSASAAAHRRARRRSPAGARQRRDGRTATSSPPSAAKHKLGFPIYFPTRVTQRAARLTSTRRALYTIRDRAGQAASRLPARVRRRTRSRASTTGVQGTNWRTPPLLSQPDGSPDRRRPAPAALPRGRAPADGRVAHAQGRRTGSPTRLATRSPTTRCSASPRQPRASERAARAPPR